MSCNHSELLRVDNRCVLCDPVTSTDDELEDLEAELGRRAQADLDDLERALCLKSFAAFVAVYWTTIDARPFAANTATDAITTALQAVGDKRIRRLVIEVGPGLAKTTLLALYSAWRLARDPSHRTLAASHAYDVVVTGLSKRTRRIVESERYRAMFGVQLREDENTASLWSTTANGRYIAAGVGGALTGFRAMELLVDDPLNSIDAISKAVRDTCHQWFGESFTTRLDGDGSIVVVGQRLGTDDLIGRLKGSGNAWTVLCLPAEFDPARQCVLHADDGEELWRDPRTTDGELLAPEILSRAKLDELKISIGSAAYESQFNENPSSDENSACPPSRWRFYQVPGVPSGARRPLKCDESPAVEMPKTWDRVVIAADLTFGSTKGDYAVVQIWGASQSGRYLIDMFRKQCGFDDQVTAIKGFAKRFPNAKVVVEKAANGAAVIETLKKSIRNSVEAMVPVGNKAQRLAGVIGVIDNGQCFLPDGANYLGDLVEEFKTFPGRHDDILDAAVWALLALVESSDGEKLQARIDATRKGLERMYVQSQRAPMIYRGTRRNPDGSLS